MEESQIGTLSRGDRLNPLAELLAHCVLDSQMEDEATQPNTQQVLDPRRLGRNNSGLADNDVADVMCILHPASPAAYQIVSLTAQRKPEHVLHHGTLSTFANQIPKHLHEEHETFILRSNLSEEAQALALRFSSELVRPVLGFTFGRNPRSCDIVFDIDSVKRVSNLHFRIYANHAGIVMLEDMSTNGTIVGETHLKGKGAKAPATRMLTHGEVIQVPSPKLDETIKFIVRIPSRDRFESAYLQNFQAFRNRMDIADAEWRRRTGQTDNQTQHALSTAVTQNNLLLASGNPFGMHWNGGDDYNVVSLLGKGAFATVYQLASKMNGELFAAKELEKKRFIKNGQLDQRLDNEMQIMKDLGHPNIVRYIDYRDEGANLYIIMEYVPIGDLQNYLQRFGPLEEPAARLMAHQTLKALRYLHRKKITHRDIKPDNILIASTNPWMVKLSDFGLSKVVKNSETFLKTFCGTLLYCAPEVFPHYGEHAAAQRGTKRRRGNSSSQGDFHAYSQSVDIWSFAAVLWFALCGKPPFEGIADKTGKKMFDQIMGTQLDLSPLRTKGVSNQAIDLLCKMLNTDPALRPGETQCLEHPWFAGLPSGPDTDSEREGDGDLESIAEEREDELEEAGAFSQLSLHDGAADTGDGAVDDDDESPKFESGDLDFLDPRASKRVKPDVLVPRNQIRDQATMRSSPDEFSDGAEEPRPLRRSPRLQQKAGRLFGEISASALQSSGLLGEHTKRALNVGRMQHAESTSGDGDADMPDQPPSNETSLPDLQIESDLNLTSDEMQLGQTLGGAESMMRDINMASPESGASPAAATTVDAEENPNPNPGTPKAANGSIVNLTSSDQVTPKAKQKEFSRQMTLDFPPSFYYDPSDPSTHNLLYASKVSGRDFLAEAATRAVSDSSNGFGSIRAHSPSPLQATMLPPTPSRPRTRSDSRLYFPEYPVVPHQVPTEILQAAPRLGLLISSTDSFTKIFWQLTKPFECWGRDRNNTFVYPDINDSRISKKAICLYHHAPGMKKLIREKRDWTKRSGLHTTLATCASRGIHVNGFHLRNANDDGYQLCGHVYTGDVITVHVSKDTGECLRFVCKFEVGEARKERPKEKWPFELQKTGQRIFMPRATDTEVEKEKENSQNGV